MSRISPRPSRDFPPRSPLSTPLDRYEIRVNCQIRLVIDAPDAQEAEDRAADEIDQIGDVSNINFPGQPVVVETDVGTSG